MFKQLAKLFGMGLLVWALVIGPVALLAQQHGRLQGESDDPTCSDQYERQAIRAYDRLDRCIQGSNSMPWYQRGAERIVCNFDYASDALQAANEYSVCMSFGTWFGAGRR